jgi:hypothetical protein
VSNSCTTDVYFKKSREGIWRNFEPNSVVLTKHFRHKFENCIKRSDINVLYDRSGDQKGVVMHFYGLLKQSTKNIQRCYKLIALKMVHGSARSKLINFMHKYFRLLATT